MFPIQKSLIEKIVRATGVQENEIILVHFWGNDDDIALMHDFSSAVAMLGASPVELQQSRMVNFDRFSKLTRQPYHEAYFERFKNVDAVIDVFNYQPLVLDGTLEETQMGFYRQYMASLFRVFMQARRFSQIRLPSQQNALESNLSPEEFQRRMLAAYDVDYDGIRSACQARAAELSGVKTLSLRTKGTCTLQFTTDGREWKIDAGDGDMPCGEVYIAPVEELTNGEIYFDALDAEDYGVYEDIVLSIDSGVVTHSNRAALNEHLSQLAPADKTVCELGFGMNPNVTTRCGYAVLDEKARGTFHIAIGGNTMFGGKNESRIHIDFVGTGEIQL